MNPPFSGLVTPKQLAPHVGLSVDTVQRKCRLGQIRVLPLGPPYQIPADEANRLTTAISHVRRTTIINSNGNSLGASVERNAARTLGTRNRKTRRTGRTKRTGRTATAARAGVAAAG